MSQIVTFEVAKLAKERGFNENCYAAYDKNGELSELNIDKESVIYAFPISNEGINNATNRNYQFLDGCAAPTQSQLRTWLLKKGYYIELIIDGWGDDNCISEDHIGYRSFIWKIGKPKPEPYHDLGMSDFDHILELTINHILEYDYE